MRRGHILLPGVAASLAAVFSVAVALGGDVVPQPAIGQPLPALTSEELARFLAGKTEFERIFNPEDGLGPIFNKDSCAGCHNAGGSGGSGSITVTRFGLLTKDGFDPLAALGGSLRQAQAISDDCAETVPPEANVEIVRVTNSTFGAGLVEAIDDADLAANESAGPGVSGRVHWVQPLEDPSGPLRAGRFGWKAQVATVLTFSGDASLNEMGITNSLVGAENAPNGDEALLAICDTEPDPEDVADAEGFEFIERITDFQRFLSPPPQTPKSGMTGEQVFIDTGCASCHVATAFTTTATAETALSGVAIKPYSDFLLHDMGVLGDNIVQGDAGLTELRTPSLWGLAIRNPMLHDGRANAGDLDERFEQAILEHAGEAAEAQVAYTALSAEEVAALKDFLRSLGRREFDLVTDGAINEADFIEFENCFFAAATVTADDHCAIADIDQNGVVNGEDFEAFLTVYQGDHPDCNANGTSDLEDIILTGFGDCNRNLVLDVCEVIGGPMGTIDPNDPTDLCEFLRRGDIDGDGQYALLDAIVLLGALFSGNAPPSCRDTADCNDDGILNLVDPIVLLSYLFIQGSPPAAPFPDCGLDLTPDFIDCGDYPDCE